VFGRDETGLWQGALSHCQQQRAVLEKILEEVHTEESLADMLVNFLSSFSFLFFFSPFFFSNLAYSLRRFQVPQVESSSLKERAKVIKADYILNDQHEGKIRDLTEESLHRSLEIKDREEKIQELRHKIQLLEDRVEKAKKQIELDLVRTFPELKEGKISLFLVLLSETRSKRMLQP